MKWLLSLIFLLLIVLFLIAFKMYQLAFSRTGDRQKAFEADHNQIDTPVDEKLLPVLAKKEMWLAGQKEEQVFITVDGLKLTGFIYQQNNLHQWVILVHGFGGNHQEMFDKAPYFSDMGFNLLLPDNRSHGQSEGRWIGFGWSDRLDIVKWANYLRKRDPEAQILLYGISMGAATVMMTLGEDLPAYIVAGIEDCGYSSVEKELTYQMQSLFHLPSFPILSFVSLINKFRQGWGLKTADAKKQLAKNKLPVLFIHGQADTFVPVEMLAECYQAQRGPKERFLVANAQHGMAGIVAGAQYWQAIQEFLQRQTNFHFVEEDYESIRKKSI